MASDRRDDKDRRDSKDEVSERQGPNPIVIIGAVSVVVILIVVVAIFAFSGSDLDSISVENPVEGKDGVSFGIITTSGNLGKWSGPATVEIIYMVTSKTVYTAEVDVKDDSGSHEVGWNEFVWGNGNYEIHVLAEGQEEWSSLNIKRVVTELEVAWDTDPVSPREKPEHYVDLNIQYLFDGSTIPRNAYPSGYHLDLVVSPPTGSDMPISNTNSSSSYKYTERIEHGTVGDYSVTGTITNTFCHPDSPYRTVSVSGETNTTLNAFPFAVIEGDYLVSLSDDEGRAQFDASGSWDDGTLEEYQWDFGDGNTTTTTSPSVQHTYTSTGDYTVTLYVVDDEDQGSENQTGLYNLHLISVT